MRTTTFRFRFPLYKANLDQRWVIIPDRVCAGVVGQRGDINVRRRAGSLPLEVNVLPRWEI
ncbi:MAG: hypothetical protein GPOALKHO_000622 [Sodalis sp.]|nr:MAG: hypothetical protein GPOALKHO_000622 [Sodalis sp.]